MLLVTNTQAGESYW